MKKCGNYLLIIITALLIAACNADTSDSGRSTNDKFVAKNFNSICLLDSTEKLSPKFTIEISIKSMVSDDKTREAKVNNAIVNSIYGFTGNSIEAATDSFVSIAQKEYYDLRPEYFNEKEINPSAEWFNYMYKVSTDVEYGRNNVIIYKSECHYYTGGAHPNTMVTYLNFDPISGEEITLTDIFKDGYEEYLCNRLTDALADKIGANSRKEILEKGYLNFNDIYPSENFMLQKDSIQFFYNRYDIAPYALGTTTLGFTYEELSNIMK